MENGCAESEPASAAATANSNDSVFMDSSRLGLRFDDHHIEGTTRGHRHQGVFMKDSPAATVVPNAKRFGFITVWGGVGAIVVRHDENGIGIPVAVRMVNDCGIGTDSGGAGAMDEHWSRAVYSGASNTHGTAAPKIEGGVGGLNQGAVVGADGELFVGRRNEVRIRVIGPDKRAVVTSPGPMAGRERIVAFGLIARSARHGGILTDHAVPGTTADSGSDIGKRGAVSGADDRVALSAGNYRIKVPETQDGIPLAAGNDPIRAFAAVGANLRILNAVNSISKAAADRSITSGDGVGVSARNGGVSAPRPVAFP